MTVNVEIDNRISKCRKILGTDPNSQIFAALAEAYRKQGDLEEAFRVCQNGLRVHPRYGAAHVVMAKINLDRGLYDWAEAEVTKARENDGNSRTIELLLAEIYIYKGEYQAAVKLLKKLAAVDPHNDHVRRLLEIAMKIPAEQAAAVGASAAKSVEPTVVERTSVSQDTPVEQPVPAPAPPETLSPGDLLRAVLKIDVVHGALFIDSEGLVIESEWQADMDATTCGAALAEVNKFLNQELMKVSFGRVDTVLIETEELVFYLMHVSSAMYLVVADVEVNLGRLRMKTAGLIQRVEAN